MVKRVNIAAIALLLVSCGGGVETDESKIRATNLPIIPTIEFNKIDGAPNLSQPQLIKGSKYDVRVEKHGNAYPNLYDYNKDGKLDLLVGEFETSADESRIKAFLNIGTAKNPKYSGEFEYVKDINGLPIFANDAW